MLIYITRDGESGGPYEVERAQYLWQAGDLLTSDYAYHEGLSEWKPLPEVLAAIPRASLSECPWCPKCKDHTEWITRSMHADAGNSLQYQHRSSIRWECKHCNCAMFQPSRTLGKIKFYPISGLLLFMIGVWGAGSYFKLIGAAFLLVGLFSFYYFIKWSTWKREQCGT